METKTNGFNHEASLKVIYEMIESAKSKIGKNYFYYLFWGYLVALTCATEYLLITVVKFPRHYLVWPALMFSGIFVTLLFTLRQKKERQSKTYIGTAMVYLWSGWLVSFLILLLFTNIRQDYGMIIPITLAMYGLAIFVSGGIVSFRPLIIGAVLTWVASVAAFYATYQVQLIIMTGVVIGAFIIPGYILKNKSKTK